MVLLVLAAALMLAGCFGGAGKKQYVASGRIVDVVGHGVANVTIVFIGDYTGTTKTDPEGRWEASVKGTVTVTPEGDGFTPSSAQVTSSSPHADFTLIVGEVPPDAFEDSQLETLVTLIANGVTLDY